MGVVEAVLMVPWTITWIVTVVLVAVNTAIAESLSAEYGATFAQDVTQGCAGVVDSVSVRLPRNGPR